ncbi:multicopper oxidase family protein [Glycomyces artemisiae]|uniref:Multicopper oxidase CueO n=1 Tax=Glycomyces artemisiae TaxID=1076443 RepID=A0A2T0UP89_9ACTN|nr:multicopper oxidase domain-containing protein [Glycomyces artemisiae]PRY59678.1 FtsP/CotA-like multicopper oxidase with cupredoxin domain [Glycomyces artemisiae]
MGEWSLPVSRRRALAIGAGIGAVAAGGLALSAGWARRPAETGDQLRSAVPLPEPFTVPLPIPPVLAPVESTADGDRYELVQQEIDAEVIPGFATRLWTYDGVFPGPTIESRRGRHTTVLHRNELPVPTVLHLHGGRTPAASDGYPTDLVLPDGWTGHAGHSMADDRAAVSNVQREYGFPLDQRAAMLWYHDHRMDFTAPAIWRGLAGLHFVRDDVEDALDLPRGDHELPLMIADRAFDEDGQLAYPAVDPSLTGEHGVTEPYLAGVLGDVVLVNGAPWPEHEVDTGLYRLRVLNGSNARHYELEAVADDGRTVPLVQIGADQGLLAAPVRHERLPIAPAERYDLLIDFGGLPVGSTVRLRNRLGSGGTADIMRFRIAREGTAAAIPETLAEDLPEWDRSEAAVVRDLAFRAGRMDDGRHGWLIDGLPFDPARTDVTARLGDVEVWRLVADVHHPVHLHLVGFRVLSRGGGAPLAHDAGLKDTISLRPGESAEIITRFDGYRGRYLFHCHNAEHEDMGMMANLEIV